MPSNEELAREIADRYTLERELGRGGMAVVFLAHDLKHSRSVALKVLHHELGDAAWADRFFREIGIAGRLSHPNILPLYDSGEAPGSRLRSNADVASLPGAIRVPQDKVFAGPDPRIYAYTRVTVQRNIYRVPVR